MMIISLEDLNQPYSCEEWGNAGTLNIPPIINSGASNDFNFHHVFVGESSSWFPVTLYFDKLGNEILRSQIEFALSPDYIPTTEPKIGEQNPTNCDFWVYGCMNPNACNYNIEANQDSGNCIYREPYYNCDGNCILDTDGDGVCDENEVVGCTSDLTACNYNSSATDLVDCTYPEQYYNCDGICIMDTDGDGVCDELEIVGCISDTTACNYNINSTQDDICIYPEENFDCFNNCLIETDCFGVCNGNGVVDSCGYCVEEAIPMECLGECGDFAVLDLFGKCCIPSLESKCILDWCDMDKNTLYLKENEMFFKTSDPIKRIKLIMEGAKINNSPYGGLAGIHSFFWTVVPPDSNIIIGESLIGSIIPENSCGTLIKLDYSGVPINLMVLHNN